MTEKSYKQVFGFFERHPLLKKLLMIIYTILPAIVMLCYPVLAVVLFILFLNGRVEPQTLIRTIIVPAVTFVSLSIVRRFLNAPRPYEVYNYTPLLPRDKKGESFPSRHSASVFIIAMVYLYINVPTGIVFLVLGVLMAASRVLAGVHFIKDVIAGALYSIILGYLGLFIF